MPRTCYPLLTVKQALLDVDQGLDDLGFYLERLTQDADPGIRPDVQSLRIKILAIREYLALALPPGLAQAMAREQAQSDACERYGQGGNA